ncbi:MAG: NPCBM/NEW2 domain-containing protein [Planctomycetes bacterium]|nr:NPCBM/NEW2 domain-containing protein [Planctomycetota bacterium]
MQARILTLLVAAVMGCWLPAQDLVTVSPVAGVPIRGGFVGLSEDGALQIRTGVERIVSVAQEKIVTAVFSEASTLAQRGAARIHLVSGDAFVGAIEGGDFDEMALATQAAGSFRVFLDHVSMVVMLDEMKSAAELPALVDGADADELFLRRGDRLDRLPGEMQRLERTGVIFDSAAGAGRLFSFINDRVVAVRLAATDPYKEPDTLLCVARFKDGARMTGVLRRGGSGQMSLKLTVGPTVMLDPDFLASLEFKSSNYRFLSDIEPVAYTEVPYLEGGPTYGLKRDEGFRRDGKLRIGETVFRKGLGIHARATCTYTLDGRFDAFRAKVGVDPVTRNRSVPGSVRVRVLVDGAEVWKSALLLAGDAAVPIHLRGLGGKARLTLEVGFGDSRGTGARAVFGDAMVLKE